MNTSQILTTLQNDAYVRRIFFGVYSADRLPSKLPVPCALVANTAPSTSQGEHWVCFFIDSHHRGDWFDSYGFPPEFYNSSFQVFLDNNTSSFKYSQQQLQDASSNVCGAYCLYFLCCRARAVGYINIVNRFTQDTTQNDKRVAAYVNKRFNIHIPPSDTPHVNQLARTMIHILKMYQ